MLHIVCMLNLPFYIRTPPGTAPSHTACTFGLSPSPNLWDGDPHFPVFFCAAPPRLPPSSVLCDIAKMAGTHTPTSRASPLWCVSISFLAPLPLVAQTLFLPLTFRRTRILFHLSYLLPHLQPQSSLLAAAARLKG